MELNDLFQKKEIDPKLVLVLRHRPVEPKLRRALPRLAAVRPDLFNAYQQTQTSKLEKAMKSMTGAGYVASFIGHEPGKALFVGLYAIGASKPLTREGFWQVPAHIEMKERYSLKGFTEEESRSSILWFDLALTDIYASWKGKLVVGWPPPGQVWWRRAHKNTMPVLAILEDSALDPHMKDWREIVLDWDELSDLSPRWKSALREWRGIYYIFDTSDGKGYVGSAYGDARPDHPDGNLLGRWLGYAASGHGGNALLRERDPHHFRFSILERVTPDMSATDIIQREKTWKDRLHTRFPDGLNDN